MFGNMLYGVRRPSSIDNQLMQQKKSSEKEDHNEVGRKKFGDGSLMIWGSMLRAGAASMESRRLDHIVHLNLILFDFFLAPS